MVRFGGMLLALLAVLSLGACQSGRVSCRLVRQAEIPVETGGTLALVSPEIDGTPMVFVLDTGAETSVLSTAALKRLGIAFDFRRQARLNGVGAALTTVTATIGRLRLGGLVIRDHRVAVDPHLLAGSGGARPDGMLGADILSRYDIDLDLPRRTMTLYRARPCAGATPPWSFPYLRAPAARRRNQLMIPITLDGHPIAAAIDTGTTAAIIVGARAARRTGVTARMLARDRIARIGGFAAPKVAIRLHRFEALRVGDDLVRDPLLPVAPLPPGIDALIGLGYLRHHRLWLAYASAHVFIAKPRGGGGAR